MVTFQVVGSYSDAPARFVSGITDIELVNLGGEWVLYTTTRAGGGLMSFSIDAPAETNAGLTLLDRQALEPGEWLSVPTRMERIMVDGQPCMVLTGCADLAMGGFTLTGNGRYGAAMTLGGSEAGVVVAQAVGQFGAETYLFTSQLGDNAIRVWRIGPDGTTVQTGEATLPDQMQGVDITALTPVTLSGGNYLLALSNTGDSLRSYRLNGDGSLTEVSSLGAAGGLGVAAPTALCLAEVGGQKYALMAAAGSSSIVVVALEGQGRMSVSDHVIDTLETRFQGVSVLTSVTCQGRTFVLAGGGDDGLTVMTLLPNGRLLDLGNLLRKEGFPLDNLTALQARSVGGEIEVFAAGESTGLMRFRIDPGDLTTPINGTDGNDNLTGGASGDLMRGGLGNDTLRGADGADILMDGPGADRYQGGAGADIFVMAADGEYDVILDFEPGVDRVDLSAWGRVYSLDALGFKANKLGYVMISFGNETLTIYPAGDYKLTKANFLTTDFFRLWHVVAEPVYEGLNIEGSALDDTQTGGSGADTIKGSAGRDTLDGRAGFDVADYSGSNQPTRVDLTEDAANSGAAEGDVLIGIEAVYGGTAGDTLLGHAEGNLLRGNGGDDLLVGRAGNDTLQGGSGDDTLDGGAGQDRLVGGAGRDEASYAADSNGVRADLANSVGNTGSAKGDSYDGVEDLRGGSGDDWLGGDLADNRLWGQGGADLLIGRGGQDSLYGGAGDDSLQGDQGANALFGGDGFDTFVFSGLGGSGQGGEVGVVVDLAGGWAESAWGRDLLDQIEAVISGAGDDSLSGHAGANRLMSDGGKDTLAGLGGDDTLMAGRGDDRIDGGEGRDLAQFLTGAAITVQLAQGSASGEGQDSLSGIEDIQTGGGNDRLTGDAMANWISSDGGEDQLWGGAGDDTLLGGAGDDTLSGGLGEDLMHGGSGADLVSYARLNPSQALTIDLRRAGSQDTGEGRDTLISIEHLIGGRGSDRLTGHWGDNNLWGGAGRDGLIGLGGHDGLYGGAGDDTLYGGSGDDVLSGGAGRDLLVMDGNGGLIRLWLQGEQQTGAGRDMLTGIEDVQGTAGHDRIYGSTAANRLMGGSGSDLLSGGAGRDRLEGGRGHDVLTGGSGADVFVFSSGRDRITDFSLRQGDKIVLDLPDALAELSAKELIRRFGDIQRGEVVLDLPGAGNRLEFDGLHQLKALEQALLLI